MSPYYRGAFFLFRKIRSYTVKVVIKRSPALPRGHAGEGKAAYMFIDEIEVD